MGVRNLLISAKITALAGLVGLATTFALNPAYSQQPSDSQQTTNKIETTYAYSPLKLQEKDSSRKGDFYVRN